MLSVMLRYILPFAVFILYNRSGDAMKIAYAGFDLMAPALHALCENNALLKLFTCPVDGVSETNGKVIDLAASARAPYTLGRITREDIDALVSDGCELLISAGYYYRIPIDPRLRMVNIHPSLLPYGRGAWPMPLAILDRLPQSGVTVHKTAESFDTGDILLQERFTLDADETLDSLMDKVNALLPAMMRRLTGDLDMLWVNAVPQGEGVYQNEPDPADYVLTPASPAAYADRVLRAFYGFEVYYEKDGKKAAIRRGRAVTGGEGEPEYPLADGYIRVVDPIVQK